MTSFYTIRQYQDLFSFPFRDPQWKRKLLIGSLISLSIYTIILAPLHLLLMGYYYRIMKRIIVEGGEPYLPEWDDWGKLFMDGLRLAIPGILFSLPGLLCLFLSIGGSFLSVLSIGISDTNIQLLQPIESLLPMMPVIGILFFLLFFGLGMILSIVLTFLLSPAICHVAATDRISGVLRIKEWWRIFRANIIGFLLAQLMMYCLTGVMTLMTQMLSMTMILIVLLPIFGSCIGLFIGLMYYTLLAQAYATGRKLVDLIE